MSERVRVFQCESCGLVVTPGHLERMCDGVHFLPSTEEEWGAPCHGEFVERILADADVVRRETIEECANAVGAISHRIIISRACAMSTIRALADAPREDA